MQTQATRVNLHFHAIFTMPLIGQNLHNYLTLARSRDVNGHVSDVTIPLDIGHFLLVVLWNQTSMASLFEDIGHKNNGATTFLSKSRDVVGHVTGHVTIQIPIPHFLFVLHCDQAPISSPFRDIGP